MHNSIVRRTKLESMRRRCMLQALSTRHVHLRYEHTVAELRGYGLMQDREIGCLTPRESFARKLQTTSTMIRRAVRLCYVA